MAGSKSSTGAGTVAATGGVERVEIVTRGEVRRSYTPEEKARLLTEAAVPGARVLLVAQRHGVSPSLVYRWRRQAEGRAVRGRRRRARRPSCRCCWAEANRRAVRRRQRDLPSTTGSRHATRWCCRTAA